MPSIFTLEGPRLGTTAVEYPIWVVQPPTPPPPPPPPPKTFSPRAIAPRISRAMSGLPTMTSTGKVILWLVGGVALLGIAWHFTKHDRGRKRRALRGPSMVKTIASESRTADEYARRIEAWNASERDPLPITKLARAYKKASPNTVARLIREAHEQRIEGRERLWSKMSRGLRGFMGLSGYRVAFLMAGKRDVSPHVFDDFETAAKEARLWKRRGWTAWLEDDAGNRIEIPKQKRKPKG